MNEAMFYNQVDNRTVHCALCPHNCKIPEDSIGLCSVRRNHNGRLYSTNYSKIYSMSLDPIEKKPLYMFYPGKRILSIGSFGCNFRCSFCQNCSISMEYEKISRNADILSPEKIVALAAKTASEGNIGIAYTYNEPLIGYEFVYDCAKLVHEADMFNILVTNGYVSRGPLETLLPHIDAMNIDLKGFSDNFYKKLGGSLIPVMETIELSQKHCHVEVTTLIIPGENDSEEETTELAKWLATLDRSIPLHLTRFFPRYKYSDKAPTPRETIYKLSEIAGKYLENVFIGNI